MSKKSDFCSTKKLELKSSSSSPNKLPSSSAFVPSNSFKYVNSTLASSSHNVYDSPLNCSNNFSFSASSQPSPQPQSNTSSQFQFQSQNKQSQYSAPQAAQQRPPPHNNCKNKFSSNQSVFFLKFTLFESFISCATKCVSLKPSAFISTTHQRQCTAQFW